MTIYHFMHRQILDLDRPNEQTFESDCETPKNHTTEHHKNPIHTICSVDKPQPPHPDDRPTKLLTHRR